MVVITAISTDECACVITTATSIKVPRQDLQLQRATPAWVSHFQKCLSGMDFPEVRKSPLETFLAAEHRPFSPLGRPLRVTTVPSGFGFLVWGAGGPALHPGPPSSLEPAPCHRSSVPATGSSSRTMARLSWGYGEHNGECRLQSVVVWVCENSEPSGGLGARSLVPARVLPSGLRCSFTFTGKTHAFWKKLKRSEVR